MADATIEQAYAAITALAVGGKLPVRAAVEAVLMLPPGAPGALAPGGLSLDIATYGTARNLVMTALAAAKANANTPKTLASPLTQLFREKSWDKPMYRYDAALFALAKSSPQFAPPQERMIQKLMTVLAECEHQKVLAGCAASVTTVAQFLASGQVGQMATIDALWNACTIPGVYDVNTAQMVDPDTSVAEGGKQQLPSSIHPVPAKGNRASAFRRGRSGTPFKTLGVGFRVEGSYDRTKGEGPDKFDAHIARVPRDGMAPQVTLDWLMLENGKDVSGTAVGGAALAPRLNIAQKDLWNESGVCVARSFFGATAFPFRGTVGGGLLWAVDVSGLKGYDTEQWQLANRGAALGPWRPGEKCYAKIPAANILGYIPILKLGDTGGGWSFSVPRDAKWQGTGYPTLQQARYMEEELAAWSGMVATVPTSFDFQQ